ncbi:hypothetical protein J6590_069171 [Homalodisca vitripennis]|nr:hypothetical protein J6590_069171 [Homalodisca vitripennis]
MSGKCGKCNLDIPASEIIAKCVECSTIFHPDCTRYVKRGSVILEKLFTEELGKINKKLDDLEKSHNDICVRCDGLERDRDGMLEELRELQQKMNDSEQHARCANLEILGIPLYPGEAIYMCLKHISKVISVPFSKKDISVAHRLRLYSRKHAHAPIVVQFVSRMVQESWLAAARHKKGINTTEISPSLTPGNAYINEQLTPHNKSLLGRARRLVTAKKIHFAGFFSRKIIIKPTENNDSIRVLHMEDLDQYDS